MEQQLIPQNAVALVEQNLHAWLTHGLADSSIEIYRYDITAYQGFAAETGLEVMDAHTLALWRDWMLLNSRKSSNTINRMLAAVKRVVKEGRKRGLVEAILCAEFQEVDGVRIDPTRLKEHARTRISPEDMRRLCESPDPGTLLGLRDRAMLHTLASSGVRASELASLTPGQIEKQENGSYILKVRGKNEIKLVSTFLSEEAYAAMQAWMAARSITSEHVFTSFTNRGQHLLETHISPQGIWGVVQKYAGLCRLEHIKPHDFRRFVGTRLAIEDVRLAQKALRHKRIQTTIDHYVLDELEAGKTDHLY